MGRIISLFVICCLWINGIGAQCPARDSLVQRIPALKADAEQAPATSRRQLEQLKRDLSRCGYLNKSTQVELSRAISVTYFYEKNYKAVISTLLPAVEMIKRSPGRREEDGKDLVQIYYFIALSHKRSDNLPECVKAQENCANASRTHDYIDQMALTAFYELGEYYYDLGDYHTCIDYFEECHTRAKRYLPNAKGASDSTLVMSNVHSSFGWLINAHIGLRQYDQAEAMLNNQVNNQGLRRESAYLGTYYGLRAEVELHKGRYDLAIRDLQKALSVEKKPLARKQLLNTLANEVYLRHLKQYDQALATFKAALLQINKDSDRFKADSVESVNIWSNMAYLYAQKGQFEQAQNAFRKAFDHIRPGISAAEILRTPPEAFMAQKKTHYLTGLFIERGNAWRRKYDVTRQPGDLEKAIAAYREADQLVNRIKAEQTNLNSKLFWRRSSHGFYEAALEACYLSNNIDDAFYFFEKSRAVLLNDQLADQKWMGEQDILLQTLSTKQLNNVNRELESPVLEPAERAALLAKKAGHQHILDSLGANIKQRNPLYYQSFVDSNFISIPQVKNGILRDYGALVELFSGDSAVYLMVIDVRHTQLKRINKAAYDSLVGRFNEYLIDYNRQNTQFDNFSAISRQLHTLIFSGVSLPPGRLIISPDGAYFPFEALLTSEQPKSFLLRDHAISYTYSARYLLNDFALPPGRAPQSFMGMAPVQFADERLAELAESDGALRSLAGYFSHADNFIGKEASRHNFLQHFSDYRIIQLYTHATDNKTQGEPLIYFADSTLTLSDLVSNRRPATSLIVLSACETGTGKFHQGEGVFSFNRGFAALGIPAAITSLWKADNRKTYLLTSLFYKFLSAGEPADVALQHAKLEFMANGSKENMLPYFWAVPVVTGKIVDIPATESSRWWLLIPAIALGLVLVVAGVGWWRKKNRTYTGQALVE